MPHPECLWGLSYTVLGLRGYWKRNDLSQSPFSFLPPLVIFVRHVCLTGLRAIYDFCFCPRGFFGDGRYHLELPLIRVKAEKSRGVEEREEGLAGEVN